MRPSTKEIMIILIRANDVPMFPDMEPAILRHYRDNRKIMSRWTAPCTLPNQKRANPSLPTGN
jgi:hypothetical protein